MAIPIMHHQHLVHKVQKDLKLGSDVAIAITTRSFMTSSTRPARKGHIGDVSMAETGSNRQGLVLLAGDWDVVCSNKSCPHTLPFSVCQGYMVSKVTWLEETLFIYDRIE